MNNMENDLFSSILEMEIKEDTLIPEEDRQWCLRIQESLNNTLAGLNSWYDQFKAAIDSMGHDYSISWYDDGGCYGYRRHNIDKTDISYYHSFEPFDSISQVAKNYISACRAFENRIIEYFNEKYNIKVDSSTNDDEYTIKNQKSPRWEDVVQKVIAHLGGRTFYDTAKDEMKNNFLNDVKKYKGGHNVSVKSKVITIHNAIYVYDRFDGTSYIDYGSARKLEQFLQYLILCADDQIIDTSSAIQGLDTLHTDFSRWYDTASNSIESVKVYKNQRIDFRFKTASAALACYNKLGLEVLEQNAA